MKNWELKIKLQVADSWVADGFNAEERLEQIQELLADLLPYAYGHEFKVTVSVTKKPDAKIIRQLQGY